MKQRRFLLTAIVALSMMLLISSVALAAPGASLLYYETGLGGGLWQYDYTFYNTSTTSEYLNNVLFTFNQVATVTGSPLPTGWTGTLWEGENITDWIDTYSTDLGYDIAAGSSLSGFSFTANYKAGDISYTAYLDDHSGNISPVSGTTALAPEPISSILFITGGAMLTGRRYWRRRKKKI